MKMAKRLLNEMEFKYVYGNQTIILKRIVVKRNIAHNKVVEIFAR